MLGLVPARKIFDSSIVNELGRLTPSAILRPDRAT